MVVKPLLVKAVKFQGLKVIKSGTPLFIIKSRRLSTSSEAEKNVILSEIINCKGIITLNRPRKLNCANLDVFRSILHKLIEWENKVEMVIIKGQGRAFSAGGDVVSVTKPGPKNNTLGKEYMLTQYTLNGLIGQYPVPYVALIDGITMGAGVGLSAHGTVRIATEKTLFSMPETLIGLYPDVGTSYILSRMPYQLGHYLALTGHRLQGTDVVKAGIATHFANSENLLSLEKGLIDLKKPEKNLNEFLSKHTEDVSKVEFSLVPHLELIENCFSASSVEEILQRLQNDGSDFALNTLKTLKKMSPISIKITKKLLEITKDKTLEECLTIDNRLSRAAIDARVSPDFFEGVRALLIDKDRNPKWNPSTVGEVTDKMVDKAFEKLSPEEELNFRRRLEDLRIRIRSNII